MNKAKTTVLISIISVASLVASLYLGNPYGNELCQLHDVGCNSLYSEAIAQPIFFFSLALLITSIILFFVREETYKAWRKFAYWAVPISVFLLWLAPTSTPGGLGISFLSYTKESASWLVSGLFLLISLIIIIRKSLNKN